MVCCAEPAGSADTVDQWMSSRTRITYTTVRIAVTTVMMVCSRITTANPATPASTVIAETTTSATTFVPVPPPQPSRVNTVAVASVASTTRTVSQPTVSSQDRPAGSRFPRTPNAARDSTIVGAEPRLPASAITPQRANDTMIPTTPAKTACQNEIPNPRMKAPYATPSTEMFDANQGQNSARGSPWRSLS